MKFTIPPTEVDDGEQSPCTPPEALIESRRGSTSPKDEAA